MLTPFEAATDYVPRELDARDWSRLEPLYRGLIERPLKCPACLRRLILDRSELDAAASEAGTMLHIEMTCHTDDEVAKRAYLDFVEHVQPRLKEASFDLDRKVATSPFAGELEPDRFAVMLRDLRTAVELFRPENIPLETELTRLDQRYAELCGAMTVTFRGQERTLPHMARFLEEPDRATREEAWRLVAQRRLRDRDAIDELFNQMLALRAQVARNAGFGNYRDYAFKAKRRFDYTPDDCRRFADGVQAVIIPTLRRLAEQRRVKLGVPTLRPWDLAVDVEGRPPLRPFSGGDELVTRTRSLFRRMDGSPGGLADLFDAIATMSNGERCLDLESRKGKAPGGYQANRDRRRLPFIFMNAAGLHRDVETMVHEAGHAFHSLLSRHDPVLANRSEIPYEFAEVASMSMELVSLPYLDEFYSPADADRARRLQMEQLASILPWIATIDQFQQWLYTHEGHTPDQRRAEWLRLRERFSEGADWSDLDDAAAFMWHRQGHLFGAPFYYIEYGIAQLGALDLYGQFTREPGAALARYKAALALGGSRRLPELFEAAGIRFDLSPERISGLWQPIDRQL